MTWHKVEVVIPGKTKADQIFRRARWCENNLSSNGVLWKHSFEEPLSFYFAQPEDLVIFRLTFG